MIKISGGSISALEYEEQLFEPSVWQEPVDKFAKATGLTISLYDKSGKRRCESVMTNPLSERLTKAGFWKTKGDGTKIDDSGAKECAKIKKPIYSVQLEIFSHLCVPLIIDDKVLAVFVIGWLPERFADPVNCDLLSKRIGAVPIEMWQLMRMQQPMSKEKLEMHARMLETFGLPLLRQLIVQIEDRHRAYRSKVISENAKSFLESTTESQIAVAVLNSIRTLCPEASVLIEISKTKGESEIKTKYGQTATIKSKNKLSKVSSHLNIPIPSPQGKELGNIEIKFFDTIVDEAGINDIQTIAAQFGTALQKVQLFQALENERSALKGANIQLQHLHKMKDEFLATVSHELRTPLNAILGWSQILKDEGRQFSDFEKAMDTIVRNAKNQSNLIEDLLDVSRIISGKMSLERENIDATSILRQSIETITPMIEARLQKLHVQIPTTPIVLKGDATRVAQIFWNILSNASKFTPEKGHISVLLENAGHYFKFEVSDSGKGISPDFIPNLFNRFSQADGSQTRRHGGLGLGLAIVRHLVELHGGTVKATSAGEGKGSTFTVFLPQNTTDLELDHAQTMTDFKSQNEVGRLNGVKVLLVDDEPDSLRLTRFVFEKSGASVQMADTAEQGFQKLKEWHPDILISDISMPGESGYDLIRRIRYLDLAEGGGTPAVAVTALASEDQKAVALNAGFQRHIAKPFNPHTLTDEVVDLLNTKQTLLRNDSELPSLESLRR